MTICVVSGYFNPIHPGHVSLIRDVKVKWPESKLLVIVNNDAQVHIKDSVPFMDEDSRCVIVSNVKGVDEAILSIDQGDSVVQTLELIRKRFPQPIEIFFCNGGDRQSWVPESDFCNSNYISLQYGFGDEKSSSSSRLIENAALFIGQRKFWRAFTDDLLSELGIDNSNPK